MSLGFLFVHQTFSQLISPENASGPACNHRPNRPHLSCWSWGHTSLTPAAQKRCLWNPRRWRCLTSSDSTVLSSWPIVWLHPLERGSTTQLQISLTEMHACHALSEVTYEYLRSHAEESACGFRRLYCKWILAYVFVDESRACPTVFVAFEL